MANRDIIVIGASAGGFEALKTVIGALPDDLPASIFIVWHMAADVRGVLPQVLGKPNKLYAAHAIDHEPIEPSRVYVAPPDRHLMLEPGRVRVTHGPKENRFRPAVDPLFRSAAYHYGPRVIGVILSGALDDGTSGLWTVKQHGGIAIVQDPNDAEVPSMPESAIREVDVDHVASAELIPAILQKLVREETSATAEADMKSQKLDNERTATEIRIAAENNALEDGIYNFGDLSPFTCPECHGVLASVKDGGFKRFRCHTGHAFSGDALLANVTESIESSLWSAIRGIDESIMMLNHMGDHFAERNDGKLAALYFQKASDAAKRNDLIRQAVFSHEQLSAGRLRDEVNGRQRANGSQGGDEKQQTRIEKENIA